MLISFYTKSGVKFMHCPGIKPESHLIVSAHVHNISSVLVLYNIKSA